MMKKLIYLMLLSCASFAFGQALVGTPTVQANAASATGYTYTPVSTSDLVFVIASTGAGSDTYTISNSGGETMHSIDTYNPANFGYAAWWFQPSSTTSHTITITTNLTDGYKLDICEFSGTLTATPIDITGHASGTSANPTVSIVTTATDIVVARVLGGAASYTVPTGYTKIFTDCTNNFCDAYKVNVTAGTQALTWTAASAAWVEAAFGVKQASGVGSVRKSRIQVINR